MIAAELAGERGCLSLAQQLSAQIGEGAGLEPGYGHLGAVQPVRDLSLGQVAMDAQEQDLALWGWQLFPALLDGVHGVGAGQLRIFRADDYPGAPRPEEIG